MTVDETIKALREWAREIRREGEVTSYPTSHEDAGLLDHAATLLEQLKKGPA